MKTLVSEIRDMVREASAIDRFPVFTDAASDLLGRGCLLKDDEAELFTVIADRIEREYMELPLDADGVPIKVGDHVWWKDGREFVITAVKRGVNTEAVEPVPGRCSSHVNFDPKEFTHRQPDTLERIEEDAMEELWHYWGCSGAICAECPALIDGKTPKDHYHTDSCEDAKVLDLLRRQRLVLERGRE